MFRSHNKSAQFSRKSKRSQHRCVAEFVASLYTCRLSKLSLSPAEVKDMWSLSEWVLSLSRDLSLIWFQLRIITHILGINLFSETISCCSQPAQTPELFISCLQQATGVRPLRWKLRESSGSGDKQREGGLQGTDKTEEEEERRGEDSDSRARWGLDFRSNATHLPVLVWVLWQKEKIKWNYSTPKW